MMKNYAGQCLCILVLFALVGCGAAQKNGGTESPEKCVDAYTYAPSAYIIYIASGDAVILDPIANNFALYCTPAQAQQALEEAKMTGRIPQGDWKVFRVYGAWEDIATEVTPGKFLLNRPAPLVDWVQ